MNIAIVRFEYPFPLCTRFNTLQNMHCVFVVGMTYNLMTSSLHAYDVAWMYVSGQTDFTFRVQVKYKDCYQIQCCDMYYKHRMKISGKIN